MATEATGGGRPRAAGGAGGAEPPGSAAVVPAAAAAAAPDLVACATVPANGGIAPPGVESGLAPTAPAGERPPYEGAAPAVGDDPLLGGRYELQAELGRGAYGVVYRARDRVADATVAIKVLATAPDASSRARMRRELQSAWRVTHPNVVRLHDLVEAQGRLALSMELVEGETLEARLRRTGQLPAADVLRLGAELTAALGAAHAAGVVHRDLKPSNIILRAAGGACVVTDFGISRPVERGSAQTLTEPGQLVGTPLYMGPEQLTGSAEVGPAVDVYALGLVLYEAAAGRRPFEGATLLELATARLTTEPPPVAPLRPELPAGLDDFLRGCLRPRPDERFADGETAGRALAAAVAAPAVDRAAPVAAGATGRAPRAARARAVAVALALVVVAVAFAVGAARWAGGRLPARDRRVAVEAVPAEAAADAWLGAAATRLLAAWLTDRDERFAVVADPARANVTLRLRIGRQPGTVSVTAEVGPRGGRLRPLASARAPSLDRALAEVGERARAALGAGQGTRAPEPAERADMQALDAGSLRAYLAYQAALRAFQGTSGWDARETTSLVDRALQADPGWPHAHALRVAAQGFNTEGARASLAAARRAIGDATRDPVGRGVLETLVAIAARRDDEAVAAIRRELARAPDDVLVGVVAGGLLIADVEALPVWQRLHELRPDLQTGIEIYAALERLGRRADADAFARQWRERAPESAQACAAAAMAAVAAGRFAEAERAAQDLLAAHGARASTLALLAEIHIAAGRPGDAGPWARRLLVESPASGTYLLGLLGVLDGRFGDAQLLLERAIASDSADGRGVWVEPAYEALIDLASGLGDVATARRHLDRLLANPHGPVGPRRVVREYQRALLDTPARGCPDLDAFVRRVADAGLRGPVRQAMLRLAGAAGCVSCATVVRDGTSGFHRAAAQLTFGRCALAEGELTLAARALEAAKTVKGTTLEPGGLPAPFSAMRARARLAEVYERQGRAAEARVELEVLVRLWGAADRPVPELADARQRFARLSAGQ